MATIEPPKPKTPDDKRCAFTGFGCRTREPMTDEVWCEGCKFYVCHGCELNPNMPWGGHDVMVHRDMGDD